MWINMLRLGCLRDHICARCNYHSHKIICPPFMIIRAFRLDHYLMMLGFVTVTVGNILSVLMISGNILHRDLVTPEQTQRNLYVYSHCLWRDADDRLCLLHRSFIFWIYSSLKPRCWPFIITFSRGTLKSLWGAEIVLNWNDSFMGPRFI